MADFVLLPRDLPWERAYDREDANAPQIAKLRLTLPADYPAGTVLKLPMPCACSEHTSRFTKIKAGTSVIIKWDLGICGLAAPPGEPQLNSELSSSELIKSERSNSGFKGVSKVSSGATPYCVQVTRKGTSVVLGRYATAEEGARAYAATPEGIADLAARDAPPPPPLPSNSELSSSELIKSERSSTGFKGVSKVSSSATPYRVLVQRGGTTVSLGYYATVDEAARGVSNSGNGATPYRVSVQRGGTTVHLGRYATAEEGARLSSSELIRSERSNSGFKCVYKLSGGATPYCVQIWRKGTTVTLGYYSTAEEGARAYAATPEGIADLAARDAPPPPPQPQLPSNSELSSGELIRSERSSTGLKGVSNSGNGATPYRVLVQRGGTTVHLGRYATAEEGARVYAATPEGIADLAARNAPPTPRPAKRPAPLPAVPPSSSAAASKQSSAVQLITSATNKTGFKGVYKLGSGATPYSAHVYRNGDQVVLGHFATAEEAARCYARTPEAKADLAVSAAPPVLFDGVELITSERSNSGFKCVCKLHNGATPYYAQVYRKGKNVVLGRYATAEEAALRYARSAEGKAELAASGGVDYLVAWKGCYAPSWEPASNLADEDGAALEGVGLGRYAAAFEEQGYDDLRYLRTMDAAERATVAESVGMKQGHANKFVKFAFEPA
ncbi:hypothetical protein EMIHUDRAFT_238946 [Emiliania huxleyi CCMP1516]|uniref:AP2/ERF domain-containing protein n=2 Tax=Emiliania huxleyi TaxID=2903 RepID=A0A0D3JKT5_EMIH1|nr:hypothetical protein EMIHUDRAFT_238946 [Emiliania huxleyi CCMP1516]EOD24120.1 hypothetical protein EMIHUDRAFT_238946 [Emiliania huxleyi CCMP1516]|eukprot:XP_005776549.1 hypothetical protein EMIHUDRAFT_238946 [Emiliania huxleyi CCMP1516]